MDISNTLTIVTIFVTIISGFYAIIYNFYLRAFKQSEFRKKYAEILKHQVWEKKFQEAVELLLKKLEYIDNRRLYIFQLMSISYTYFLFSVSWIFGSEGSISSLRIYPNVDIYFFKIIIFIIPFVVSYITYKAHRKSLHLKIYNRNNLKFIVSIVSTVVWFYLSGNIYISLVWIIVGYTSPIMSIQTIIILFLIKTFKLDFLTAFFLISVIINIIFSFKYILRKVDDVNYIVSEFYIKVGMVSSPSLLLISIIIMMNKNYNYNIQINEVSPFIYIALLLQQFHCFLIKIKYHQVYIKCIRNLFMFYLYY